MRLSTRIRQSKRINTVPSIKIHSVSLRLALKEEFRVDIQEVDIHIQESRKWEGIGVLVIKRQKRDLWIKEKSMPKRLCISEYKVKRFDITHKRAKSVTIEQIIVVESDREQDHQLDPYPSIKVPYWQVARLKIPFHWLLKVIIT